MSGLREALEKLVQGWQYVGEPVDMTRTDSVMDDCADELKRLLATHPAEPAPVRRYRLAWLSARRRASIAAKAFYVEASAARELESAVAEMQPAPVANRERVVEVLHGFSNGEPVDDDGWVLFADELEDIANALLAAGVFRDEATVKAEALEEFANGLDHIAGEWATPSKVADIPEGWDAHHLIVRGATQNAWKNAASEARAAAARLAAS